MANSKLLLKHLLEDGDGISSLPNTEIFEQLALMGYASDSNKLTFQKGGHTLGSDEGSMTLNELTILCTQLSTKLESLEQDLKETKKGRTSADTKILLDQEEPTELVEDLGSGEKGEKEISTANISVSTASATLEVSTASATPEVSTAAENLVYIKRSAEK
ncbi:hypothetical protein Tco_0022410, partial [Tanacetum coccineum]